MGKVKTSIIWNVSQEDFESIIKDSHEYKEILFKLGLPAKSGGNYKTLKQRIVRDGCDVSHIEAGKKSFRGGSCNKKPLEEYFTKTNLRTSSFRRRLIEEGFFDNKCSECGQGPWWNNKPLVLQLDHINGNHNDNRLENIRILCPHCHTQTKTYGGRNAKLVLESDFCKCGSKKDRKSNSCNKCRKYKTKIIWPNKEDLQKLLLEKPATQIAKELGVSDSIIGIRARKLGLIKPGRGDWSKKNRADGGG